jgi:hypothetical protein
VGRGGARAAAASLRPLAPGCHERDVAAAAGFAAPRTTGSSGTRARAAAPDECAPGERLAPRLRGAAPGALERVGVGATAVAGASFGASAVADVAVPGSSASNSSCS